MNKFQTLKGFRDFLPQEVLERNFIIQKITTVFEKYGFDPLQTPALEYAEVLLGKYGEEADKLIYSFDDRGGRKVGLRYDQTVPTARVVGQYFQELSKPFKRYQIQNVWRSENTQKGRYREFMQCDADIIGEVYPPIADAEILSLFYEIYKSIGIKNIKIIVNSRVVLRKLIDSSLSKPATKDEFLSIVRSIDKLDKIGIDGVETELKSKTIQGLNTKYLFERINEYTNFGLHEIDAVDSELAYSLQMATENFGLPKNAIVFSPTLARGLDYYTGLIFEVISEGVSGSLGGGGRYDNLIEQLGGPKVPAVGFAVGFDRTLEVAKDQNIIPEKKTVTKALIVYIDNNNDTFPQALNLAGDLRSKGANIEIYLNPKEKDLSKQLKYADKKGIPFAIIIDPKQADRNYVILKDMKTRLQTKVKIKDLFSSL